MHAPKQAFPPRQPPGFLLRLLIFVLFLSSSAFAGAQGQIANPLAKQQPAGSLRSLAPQALHPALPLDGSNIIRDPSFDQGAYNSMANWIQYSENFFTPLCIVAYCGSGAGTAGPRSGAVWSWFGGVDFSDPDAVNPEFAFLQQQVMIPSCGATLKFYLWIGAAAAGSGADDVFIAQVGSTHVFTANATQKNSYPGYTLVTVNLPPGSYTQPTSLYFFSEVSDQSVTFNLDDISLTPNCLIISGDAGIEEVTINYTGGAFTTSAFTTEYSFEVPVGWSGTVTPSKGSYTFSPLSRTYTNITSYQTGQNYTATPILHSISGSTGVGDVALGYVTSGWPQTAYSQPDGSYSLDVLEGWSGTVTPVHDCFTFSPTDLSYSNVIADQPSQDYTPTFNTGGGCADINTEIGGVNRGRFGLLPGASTRVRFAGVNEGPVKLESTNAVPLIGAERLIYKVGGVNASFTEMMALPNSQLDNTYWLPWYNNVDLDTQLRIGNVSGATASVRIFIGDVEVTPPGGITLLDGDSTRVRYTGVNDGPVKIVSDQNIVAAERLIYKVNGKNTSFSEMMALPNSQLDNTYWLPWYNNVDLDTQLRIANVSDQPATVHVAIGSMAMPPINLAAGESTRLRYMGVNNGPVKIQSDQNIVAAERLIYKVGGVNTSFTEMMALPNSSLSATYWLPWYNNADLDTQLRIGNVSAIPASVHIYIGGVEMTGSPITLAAGESTRVSFVGVNSGPVQIVSDQNIVAAERLIYKVKGINTSFSEMMALPNNQLDTTYWLPWYNNADLDTQLRFGVP